MDLVSCENCGVVLDQDHLVFCPLWIREPHEAHEHTIEIDGVLYATAPCPVCEERIIRKGGEDNSR